MAKHTPGATYTDAELLVLFREALASVAVSGQSYRMGSREYTRADLPEIRSQIEWLETRVNKSSGGGSSYNTASRGRV